MAAFNHLPELRHYVDLDNVFSGPLESLGLILRWLRNRVPLKLVLGVAESVQHYTFNDLVITNTSLLLSIPPMSSFSFGNHLYNRDEG